MRKFGEKYVLMKKLDIFGSAEYELEENNASFEESDTLVFGRILDNFQEDMYDVYTKEIPGNLVDLKIDDNGKNTFIRNVPKGSEQVVLDDYLYNVGIDKFFTDNEFVYRPTNAEKYISIPLAEHRRVIEHTKNEILPVRTEVEIAEIQKKVEELKTKAPKLYKKLEASGILKNTLENTEQLKKLEEFMNYLNFLYTVTRKSDTSPEETSQEISVAGKTEIVKKYLELGSEYTDYIWTKEFLQYKYAEAIIRDIKRMGYFVQIAKDSSYEVRKLKGGAIVKDKKSAIGVYADIFKIENKNNHAIDTALFANVIVENPEFKDVVTQKDFINKLLDKHNILPKKRKGIIDKTDYLILDSKEIIQTIKTKLNKSTSAQVIKELSILQNFVVNKAWEDNGSYDKFNKANNYAKGFLKNKAFIQAYKEGRLDGLKGKGSVPDEMAKFIDNNRAGAFVFGILAWIMGFEKTAMGAMGVGIFGGAAGDLLKTGANSIDSEDTEDRIKPLEFDQIAVTLEDKEYDEKYVALVAYHSQLDNNQLVDTSNAEVKREDKVEQLNHTTFNNMLKAITYRQIDVDLTTRESDIQLKAVFDEKGETFTLDEVKKLISIFKKSGIGEEGDKTTLDYLSDGLDQNNRPYETINPFTSIISNKGAQFDKYLNAILLVEYDNTKDKKDNRDKILKIREKIDSEFLINFDKSMIDSKITNINTFINKYTTEFPGLEIKLKPIFDNYKAYENINTQLEPFEGIYDSNIEVLKTEFKIGNSVDLYNDITTKLTKLNILRVIDPSLVHNEPFKSLNEDIEKKIASLEAAKLKLLNDTTLDIVDEGRITPLSDFSDRNSEYLKDDIKSNLDKIKQATASINSNKDLDNLNSQLKDIKGEFAILSRYHKALPGPTLPVTASTNPIIAFNQKKIVEYMNEFNSEKIQLENIVKNSLSKFYKENQTKLSDINGLTIPTTINSNNIINILDEIEKTKKYIGSNNDTESKNILTEAKSIFGKGFNVTDSSGVSLDVHTIEKVKVGYDLRVKAFKIPINIYIKSLIQTISTINSSQEVKKEIKTLNKIKETNILGNSSIILDNATKNLSNRFYIISELSTAPEVNNIVNNIKDDLIQIRSGLPINTTLYVKVNGFITDITNLISNDSNLVDVILKNEEIFTNYPTISSKYKNKFNEKLKKLLN